MFTTSSLLLADLQTNSSERADVNTSAQDSNNDSHSGDEEYLSDSNSSSSSSIDDSTETRPAKRFKQDSSDITSDTEPFDFCGGDD